MNIIEDSTQKVPMWLRKPHHKKEVVATERGWVVKETGEVLTRVPNLKQKIAEYFGSGDVVAESQSNDLTLPEQSLLSDLSEVKEKEDVSVKPEEPKTETTTSEPADVETTTINKPTEQPVSEPTKRRGRPAKVKG